MDVEKRSIKIFIIESDRFHAVVREGGAEVAVASWLGDLEKWDQLKKNKRIREEQRGRIQSVTCVYCQACRLAAIRTKYHDS